MTQLHRTVDDDGAYRRAYREIRAAFLLCMLIIILVSIAMVHCAIRPERSRPTSSAPTALAVTSEWCRGLITRAPAPWGLLFF